MEACVAHCLVCWPEHVPMEVTDSKGESKQVDSAKPSADPQIAVAEISVAPSRAQGSTRRNPQH